MKPNGAAYLYRLNTLSAPLRLIANDSTADALFGSSVALHGELAFVGARGDNGRNGSVYIFDVTTGSELAKLVPSGTICREFGASLAVSDALLLVGAPLSSDRTGAAFVFSRTPPFEQLATIAPHRCAWHPLRAWRCVSHRTVRCVPTACVHLSFLRPVRTVRSPALCKRRRRSLRPLSGHSPGHRTGYDRQSMGLDSPGGAHREGKPLTELDGRPRSSSTPSSA